MALRRCYHDVMRRLLASAIVLAFFSPLIAPAFTATVDQAELPACCRREGAHHCMMYRMAMGRMAWPYRVIQDKCPYSPFAHLSILMFHGFFGEASPWAELRMPVEAAAVGQAEAGYRISWLRSRQKRGPPRMNATRQVVQLPRQARLG